MIKNIKYLLIPTVFLPIVSSAQLIKTEALFSNAEGIITNILIPLAFAVALLYFFWGVAMYIRSEGTGKEEGKKIMIWGVVALFVMSSVWGLVAFIRGELLGNENVIIEQRIPTIVN